MLLVTFYAFNYAGIIGLGLITLRTVISQMVLIREWVGGSWWGGVGWWGWVSSRRWAKPATKVHRVVLSPQQVTDMYTTHRMGQG